jgi:hypothetical protein
VIFLLYEVKGYLSLVISPYTHDVLCVVLLVPCSCVDATLCVVVTGRGACMAGERQPTDQAPDTCG